MTWKRSMARWMVCGVAALLLLAHPASAQTPICFKTSSSQIGCTPVTTATNPLPVTGAVTVTRVVNTLGLTSSVIIFNNTTCTGAKIGTFSTVSQNDVQINAAATVGICAQTAGVSAADITVYYR